MESPHKYTHTAVTHVAETCSAQSSAYPGKGVYKYIKEWHLV